MKITHRYVIARVLTSDPLEDSLVKAVRELWGLRGLAEARISVVRMHSQKGLAIIKVRREGLLILRAALAVHPSPIVRIVRVAGTLKRAERIAGSLCAEEPKDALGD